MNTGEAGADPRHRCSCLYVTTRARTLLAVDHREGKLKKVAGAAAAGASRAAVKACMGSGGWG
jgi:hypothetical protein